MCHLSQIVLPSRPKTALVSAIDKIVTFRDRIVTLRDRIITLSVRIVTLRDKIVTLSVSITSGIDTSHVHGQDDKKSRRKGKKS